MLMSGKSIVLFIELTMKISFVILRSYLSSKAVQDLKNKEDFFYAGTLIVLVVKPLIFRKRNW